MKKLLLVLTLGLAIISCKKEIDSPPENVLTDGQIITMDTLLAMYEGDAIKFTTDVSVFATVTMDEVDGNVYKNIYIQDGESAINMRLQSSGDLYVGDYIRINLNGTVLSKFSGVMQLDSVDYSKNIAIQSKNKPLSPKVVTVADINSSFQTLLFNEGVNPNTHIPFEYLSQLVKLENVQFTASELGGTYADGPAQQSKNIYLEDCNGNQIIIRNSGFASFANELIAEGNGTLTAIVSRYNEELQIYIRSFGEIDMAGDRCAGQISLNNFESNTLDGWQSISVSGAISWLPKTLGGNTFANISNYDGTTNIACETWLVSPEINLSSSPTASISLNNDVNYSGAQLQMLVSTEYTGTGDPSQTGNWTDITASVTWDPNTTSWGFSSTGEIDLTQFVGNTIYIAFKYTGTASDGSTWELDDIKITG